jgi:hypothetical protein
LVETDNRKTRETEISTIDNFFINFPPQSILFKYLNAFGYISY